MKLILIKARTLGPDSYTQKCIFVPTSFKGTETQWGLLNLLEVHSQWGWKWLPVKGFLVKSHKLQLNCFDLFFEFVCQTWPRFFARKSYSTLLIEGI